MNIKATSFERDDGLDIVTYRKGWILRDCRSPLRVYNPNNKTWTHAHLLNGEQWEDFILDFEKAMSALTMVEYPVR